MTYIIEVVCGGNNARSPIAETIGNNYIKDKGLESKLQIVSSGTRVEIPWDYGRAVKFIECEHKNLFCTLEYYRELESFLSDEQAENKYREDEAYRSRAIKLADSSRKILMTNEAILRNLVLSEIGLRYKGQPKQTRQRDDVDLVLGIDERVTEEAKKIYRGREKPRITSLRDYGSLEQDIEEPIFRLNDIKFFIKIRDSVSIGIKNSIDRFVKEKGL